MRAKSSELETITEKRERFSNIRSCSQTLKISLSRSHPLHQVRALQAAKTSFRHRFSLARANAKACDIPYAQGLVKMGGERDVYYYAQRSV